MVKVRDIVGETAAAPSGPPDCNFDRKDLIGSGSTRKIYAHADPGLVVKCGNERFNRNEWEIWSAARQSRAMRPWFAPCKEISADGQQLVQRRAAPMREDDRPFRFPRLFCWADLSPVHWKENWGLLDGRPVCIDYAALRAATDLDPAAIFADEWLTGNIDYDGLPITNYIRNINDYIHSTYGGNNP